MATSTRTSPSPDAATGTGKRSEPRERLLRVASGLFYTKGIRAVGVEEVLAEAGVTRATLYRHFKGKDDLVATYLRATDQLIRGQIDDARREAQSPEDEIRAIARLIGEQITSPGFRGCAFLNAAAEYPDAQSPAHQAVLEQRAWLLETMIDLYTRCDATEPEAAAQHFVMLRDGAMAAGCLSDPRTVADVLYRGVDRMLTVMGTRGGSAASS